MAWSKWSLGFLVVAVVDLIASYYCYRQTPLLGDLANVVVPSPAHAPVLSDPLGWRVWTEGARYVGPNRFFGHWLPYVYFNHVPLWLQTVFHPVESVYIASGGVKLLAHLGISIPLTYWLVKMDAATKRYWPVLLALMSSLILASPYGYFFPLRIVDQSVIYTFFYALSFVAVLLYWHPFLGRHWGFIRREWRWWEHLLLWLFSFVALLHGPVNAPTMVIGAGLVLWALWWRGMAGDRTMAAAWRALRALPMRCVLHMGWVIVLGLYAIVLGFSNLESSSEVPPLVERYGLLFRGVVKSLFEVKTTPLPLLVLTAAFYALVAKRLSAKDRRLFLEALRWGSLFALLYTLLLPFGGYRSYRNYLFRFDTMLPISVLIFGYFGWSARLLLKYTTDRQQTRALQFLLVLVVASSAIDSLSLYPVRNDCERSTLYLLSEAKTEPVLVPACTILSWGPTPITTTPSIEAELLARWNITDRPLVFYHQPTPSE